MDLRSTDLTHKRLDMGASEGSARALRVSPDVAEVRVLQKRAVFVGAASALHTKHVLR
jgi:hypothetical protein